MMRRRLKLASEKDELVTEEDGSDGGLKKITYFHAFFIEQTVALLTMTVKIWNLLINYAH